MLSATVPNVGLLKNLSAQANRCQNGGGPGSPPGSLCFGLKDAQLPLDVVNPDCCPPFGACPGDSPELRGPCPSPLLHLQHATSRSEAILMSDLKVVFIDLT